MSLAELRKLLLIWMGKPSLTLFSATGDLVLTDAVSLLVRSIHVVFGHVISGQAVVKQIEGGGDRIDIGARNREEMN